MGRAIRWVFVALVGIVIALVGVAALVKIDNYATAVYFTSGTDKALKLADQNAVRTAQKGATGRKITVVVNGVTYEASYTIAADQPETMTIYDDNLPVLAEGQSVRIKGDSQTVLQKVTGL